MPEDLTVLVFDPGARGHAISDAYERSRRVKKIIVASGNDFIGFRRRKEVIVDKDCDLKNIDSMCAIAERYRPDLIDVAQDDAIATGVGDTLRDRGFTVFCPSQQAAQIEWDKVWSREFMARHGISIPEFHAFSAPRLAEKFLDEFYGEDPHRVAFVKAAGLAAGKGALKASSYQQAVACVRRMSMFRDAGRSFLIEKALAGQEFSYTVIADGTGAYRAFIPAQDYKLAHVFDEGGQTGGMGTVAPTHVIDPIPTNVMQAELVEKALEGMSAEGRPYKGILYVGGMRVVDQHSLCGYKPYCIEYNARWGDPEAQVVLPGVNDYAEMVLAATKGRLDQTTLEQDGLYRVCLVGALRGYPGDYRAALGKRIYGLEEVMYKKGVRVFGAAILIDGKFYANGGRLFSIVGEGLNLLDASGYAYEAMAQIYIEGNNLQYRTDIGWQDRENFLRMME